MRAVPRITVGHSQQGDLPVPRSPVSEYQQRMDKAWFVSGKTVEHGRPKAESQRCLSVGWSPSAKSHSLTNVQFLPP